MAPIDDLLSRMDALLQPMRAAGDERQHFLSTYMRTTIAVKHEIERGAFVDGDWTERWDIAFADLYLDALEEWNAKGSVPGPWRIAFEAANATPRVPPIRHLLLGMNAHINYDLPQALILVITDDQFDDPALVDAARGTTNGSTPSCRAAWPPRTASCGRWSSPATAPSSTTCSRRSTVPGPSDS